jgi:vacuolar-type H+-ATPase subunit I/STV1
MWSVEARRSGEQVRDCQGRRASQEEERMDTAEIIKRVEQLLAENEELRKLESENEKLKSQLEKVWAHVEALEALETIEALLDVERPLMMADDDGEDRPPALEEDDWHETKAGAGVGDRWRLNGKS